MFNLSNFKEFVKRREDDIIILSGVVLIALVSFGAGRLTASKIVQEPIVIENGGVERLKEAAAISSELGKNEEKRLVASRNGKYYHWPWSPWAEKIKAENKVWFDNEEAAQKAGYRRSSNFCDLAPVEYDCR